MKTWLCCVGLCLILACAPSSGLATDETPGTVPHDGSNHLGLQTVFVHRSTVIDVCGEAGSAPGLACEALVLGLFNGFLYGTIYGDYVHCMPEQIGPDKLVPVFVTYVRDSSAADLEHAGSLMLDMIEALGWAGRAGEACLAQADQAAGDSGTVPSDGEDAGPVSDVPLETQVANADADRGERVFRRCSACHSPDVDGRSLIGPRLWEIVGRPVASIDGFPYSTAMISHGEVIGTWGLAELDAYLQSPRDAVPGTISAFPGVRDATERIDLLAYLTSLAAE